MQAKTKRRQAGVVSPGEAYTVRELCRRLNVGDYLWRKLRPKLRVRHIGHKHIVLADDILRFLDSDACDSPEGIDQ